MQMCNAFHFGVLKRDTKLSEQNKGRKGRKETNGLKCGGKCAKLSISVC